MCLTCKTWCLCPRCQARRPSWRSRNLSLTEDSCNSLRCLSKVQRRAGRHHFPNAGLQHQNCGVPCHDFLWFCCFDHGIPWHILGTKGISWTFGTLVGRRLSEAIGGPNSDSGPTGGLEFQGKVTHESAMKPISVRYSCVSPQTDSKWFKYDNLFKYHLDVCWLVLSFFNQISWQISGSACSLWKELLRGHGWVDLGRGFGRPTTIGGLSTGVGFLDCIAQIGQLVLTLYQHLSTQQFNIALDDQNVLEVNDVWMGNFPWPC